MKMKDRISVYGFNYKTHRKVPNLPFGAPKKKTTSPDMRNSFLRNYFTGNKVKVSTAREKLLLLELLMNDIRMDWSINATSDRRVKMCIVLCKDLLNYTESSSKMFRVLQRLAVYSTGDFDGRWLRVGFDTLGGYVGMEKYHRMKPYAKDRSPWFKRTANDLLINDYLLTEK